MLELHVWLIKEYKAHNKNGTITALTFLIIVKPVLKVTYEKWKKVLWYDRWPLKRGSVHMKFSMTGQEKGGLLIIPIIYKKNIKIYIINHVGAERLTTGWMILSGNNSPPAKVLTQW